MEDIFSLSFNSMSHRCHKMQNNGAVMVHLFRPDIFFSHIWEKSFHFTADRICRLKEEKKELKESYHVIASTTKQRQRNLSIQSYCDTNILSDFPRVVKTRLMCLIRCVLNKMIPYLNPKCAVLYDN